MEMQRGATTLLLSPFHLMILLNIAHFEHGKNYVEYHLHESKLLVQVLLFFETMQQPPLQNLILIFAQRQ